MNNPQDSCSWSDFWNLAMTARAAGQRKTHRHRDEPADRNLLLQAGREIGGTHDPLELHAPMIG